MAGRCRHRWPLTILITVNGTVRHARLMSTAAPPPRFVVRATVATMIMVGFLLSAVFIVVMLDVRDRVRGAVSERLVASQRMLSALEHRRTQELLEQAATLAEDPTLKSAMDAYVVTASRRETEKRELVNTSRRSSRTSPRVCIWTSSPLPTLRAPSRDRRTARRWLAPPSERAERHGSCERGSREPPLGHVPRRVHWPHRAHRKPRTSTGRDRDRRQLRPRAVGVVGRWNGDRFGRYGAGEHAAGRDAADADARALRGLPTVETVKLGAAEYAVRLLFRAGPAGVYVVDSIDASAAPALSRAIRALGIIALGAFALALLATSGSRARSPGRSTRCHDRSPRMTPSRDFEHAALPHRLRASRSTR